ncbi:MULTISPECIES: hypothetical protein [unclassified Thalassospira]|uniref:hypothetical protein n=1 Tax=unclassified Thalassospira TaxID=2648997 RepID=UPI0025E8C914|nr:MULTISPECIES: hypothetical protein [unclassified Thalassospira]|tara:strand:+ start:9781 stop:9939 length:159 start_codon:yes stop_codon:yes gene_type:complete
MPAFVLPFVLGAAVGGGGGFLAADGLTAAQKLVRLGVLGAGVYVAGKYVKAW